MREVMRTLDEAQEAISLERPFRFGRMINGFPALGAGEMVLGHYGFLPEQYREDVNSARYVVRSYGTPIGWVRPDGTYTVPDVGYSPTTAQHQYTVKAAWGLYDRFPARGREVRPAGGGPRSGGIDG